MTLCTHHVAHTMFFVCTHIIYAWRRQNYYSLSACSAVIGVSSCWLVIVSRCSTTVHDSIVLASFPDNHQPHWWPWRDWIQRKFIGTHPADLWHCASVRNRLPSCLALPAHGWATQAHLGATPSRCSCPPPCLPHGEDTTVLASGPTGLVHPGGGSVRFSRMPPRATLPYCRTQWLTCHALIKRSGCDTVW